MGFLTFRESTWRIAYWLLCSQPCARFLLSSALSSPHHSQQDARRLKNRAQNSLQLVRRNDWNVGGGRCAGIEFSPSVQNFLAASQCFGLLINFMIIILIKVYSISRANRKSGVFDQIFLRLFDDHYIKLIAFSRKFEHFYCQFAELEIVVDGFSFFLAGFSSVYKSWVRLNLPENTKINLSLSFRTKSSR